jgi:hypothetical protein
LDRPVAAQHLRERRWERLRALQGPAPAEPDTARIGEEQIIEQAPREELSCGPNVCTPEALADATTSRAASQERREEVQSSAHWSGRAKDSGKRKAWPYR